MTAREHLHAQAERIRQAQALGRSELMQRLFDYLVECSLADKAPKEIEIAIEVFGRNSRFEAAQDAMVRVYIHKLRRKLDAYYVGAGRDEQSRLTIPRGEYRLLFEEQESGVDPTQNMSVPLINGAALENETVTPQLMRSWPRVHLGWGIAALALLLVVNLAVWWSADSDANGGGELRATREHPVWREIMADTQPIYIVVGDYYIFGELAPATPSNPEQIRRLVREFAINSSRDLDDWIANQPELADHYMDVALRYLPVSAAFALQRIAPLLQGQAKHPRQVQVILASDLTPSIVRSSHIVYLGLLSGMGMLRDLAFADSQFAIGDTYDELIDRKTNQLYISQASVAFNDNSTARFRDYGYFSTLVGPTGKRIVILAGTRDVALMHIAETISRAESLLQLSQRIGAVQNFEALYAVEGLDRTNLNGKLLVTATLDRSAPTARVTSRAALVTPLASLQTH